MKYAILIIICLALLGCSDAKVKMIAAMKGGEPRLDGDEASAPFTIAGSHILQMRPTWNGVEIPVVLDTGGMTMLDRSTADSLGLEGTDTPQQGVALAEVDDIALGGAHVLGLKASVMDYNKIFGQAGDKTGMIGGDWLRHFQTTIDYRRSELRFRAPAKLSASAPGDHLMDMTIVIPYLPTVDVTVNGERGYLGMIDTGLSYDFVAPMAMFDKLPPEVQATAIEADGWFAKWPFPGDERSRLVRLRELRIGDIEIPDAVVLFTGTPPFLAENTVLIGKYFLDDYLTTLDYEHEQVLLREAPYETQSIAETFGVRFSTKGDTMKVVGVWNGSPAGEAGIAPGDVVWSVNGVPAAELDRGELDRWLVDPETTQMEIELGEGDERRTVRLEKAKIL